MYQRREVDSTQSNDIMIIDVTEENLSQNKKLPENVDDMLKYIIRQNNEFLKSNEENQFKRRYKDQFNIKKLLDLK